MEKVKGNFQNMGGARGVGNPVCPRAAPARTVDKCWVVHAFKRWGRESPREAVRPRFSVRRDFVQDKNKKAIVRKPAWLRGVFPEIRES